MGELEPVVKPLAQRWLNDEISAENYFAQVYDDELPRAAEQVDKELERRRQLAAVSSIQAAITTKETELLTQPTVGQKIIGLIKNFYT